VVKDKGLPLDSYCYTAVIDGKRCGDPMNRYCFTSSTHSPCPYHPMQLVPKEVCGRKLSHYLMRCKQETLHQPRSPTGTIPLFDIDRRTIFVSKTYNNHLLFFLSVLISACGNGGQWEKALSLLQLVRLLTHFIFSPIGSSRLNACFTCLFLCIDA
jgi:pentatricopeptide repeat protein